MAPLLCMEWNNNAEIPVYPAHQPLTPPVLSHER